MVLGLKPFQNAVALGLVAHIHFPGPRKIQSPFLVGRPDADLLLEFGRWMHLPVRMRQGAKNRKRYRVTDKAADFH